MNQFLKILVTVLTKISVILIFVLLTNYVSGQKFESPIASHQKLHKGQDDWLWMGSDNIKLFEAPFATNNDGGDFRYTSFNQEDVKKIFTIKWNTRTDFRMFEKEEEEVSLKGKCFFMVYCKKHKLALQLEERNCSFLENKKP